MNLVIFQCLDRTGGDSRASLSGTLSAVRDERPEWNLKLVTREFGPISRMAEEWSFTHSMARFPRFRKVWEKPAFWRDCRSLAESITGFSPDGILSNEWVTAPHALAVGRRLGIPAMSYVRDFVALERGRKYQLHRMDRLLCVSESMRRGLISAGYDPSKVFTVYNPVLRPMSREPASEVRERILQQTGVDRWLLYLGRVSPRKNQIAAVETLRRLREISGQRWGLLLAGDADEAYAAAVDQAVTSSGLEGAVLRLGMIAQPGWLFELAEASIMTSRSEGLARVLIESFLCGKPAFSYPVEGIGDVYGSELDTFVTRESDPGDLATKILEALANRQQLRYQTERLANELEKRHSVPHHVEAFERAVRCEWSERTPGKIIIAPKGLMGKYAIRRLLFRAGSSLIRPRDNSHAGEPGNVLFIWIPKTAGTSVFTFLKELGMRKYKSLDQARYRFPGSGVATFVHQSIPSLVEAGAIPEAYVQSAFKFSFVRNPYDRAVSLYHYFRRYDRLPPAMEFERFLETLEQEWDHNRNLRPPGESLLSARVCYRGEFVSPHSHTLHPPGTYNVLEWSQCRPQSEWLQGMGGLDQIHLGRMENIDEDFKTILQKIFGACGKSHERVLEIYGNSMPKHNVTAHSHFMEHYKDPALRRMVEKIYQSDFENFGY